MTTSSIKPTSPEEMKQSRIFLAEGSVGSMSAVSGEFDSPKAKAVGGRGGTKPAPLVAGVTVTENGRTVEYSSLRTHKQRVIRSYERMRDDPSRSPLDLNIQNDQDTDSIVELTRKQAERDAAKRATPVHKMAFQGGVGFMQPASAPRPIRPVPPPIITSQKPGSAVDQEKFEPPKFPLFY